MRALESTNPDECATAAVELGAAGATSALPKLRLLTTHASDIVAIAAMYACWQLGEDRIDIDRLVTALGSDSEEVVQETIQAVSGIGAALVDRLAPILSESPAKAALALRALDEIHAPAAKDAIRALGTKDRDLSDLRRDVLDDWEDEDSDAD